MQAHLLQIITRWEQSAQGEDGKENEDAEELADQDDDASFTTSIATTADGSPPNKTIGSLSGRPACALQSRAAFLNGRPSYLLYFWEIADQHQLLQSLLQHATTALVDQMHHVLQVQVILATDDKDELKICLRTMNNTRSKHLCILWWNQ